ncbi:MAG: ribosome-associated translation inhibitor RaiA [Bacteroidota bacterium]|jgi:ribosomal subunit interface protein
MNIKFTARHFRPRATVKQHALQAVEKLGKFYDGIVSATVVLSFERATNSVKTAEINLHVYGTTLAAKESSEEFLKSIDAAAEKLNTQLAKYKSRRRAKDKTKVRAIREKV